MTVDSEGCLWSAHWDGWRITRYRPDGSIKEVYELPVQRPTSLVFTGPALRSVVVTSAAVAAEPDAGTEGQIEDGDLLAFEAEVQGLACPRFDFGGFD